MSFLFRKNGSSSGRRIRDKLRGRNADRGKREEEEEEEEEEGERVSSSGSLPQAASPWGNLKAVIVDEEGLDVIYWKELLELESRRSGAVEGFYRGSEDESSEEAFSFHVKNSQSSSSTTGAVGKHSKFLAPGASSSPAKQTTCGRYPPLPLPPAQLAAAIASSSTLPPPLTINQALPPPPPPPIPAKKASAPPPPPPVSKTGPPKPPGNGKGPTKAAESSSAIGITEDPAQPKLKPLHWDKVNPDANRSMVWHRIDGGSFK